MQPKFYMHVVLTPYIRVEIDKNSVSDHAVTDDDKRQWPDQWAEFEKGEGRMDTKGLVALLEELQKRVAAMNRSAAKLGKRVVILEKAEPLGDRVSDLEEAATVTSPYKRYAGPVAENNNPAKGNT